MKDHSNPAPGTPRLAAASPAVGARLKRTRDGSFVCGPLRVRPRARSVTPLPLTLDEAERREHVRRWARMMIVHLERTDFDARHEGYVPTLTRLRDLLDREIQRVAPHEG